MCGICGVTVPTPTPSIASGSATVSTETARAEVRRMVRNVRHRGQRIGGCIRAAIRTSDSGPFSSYGLNASSPVVARHVVAGFRDSARGRTSWDTTLTRYEVLRPTN
jgi:hypothetical protein